MNCKMNLKNGQTLVVKPASPEDAADLLAFLRQVSIESENLLIGERTMSITVEQEAEFIKAAQSGNSVMLLGWVEDRLVATASLSTPGLERIAHTSELSIVVEKACWGTGAGSAMMQSLVDWAKENGSIRLIHLGVRGQNQNAIRLYEKFGFEKVGEFRHFFNINGVYDNEVLMALSL